MKTLFWQRYPWQMICHRKWKKRKSDSTLLGENERKWKVISQVCVKLKENEKCIWLFSLFTLFLLFTLFTLFTLLGEHYENWTYGFYFFHFLTSWFTFATKVKNRSPPRFFKLEYFRGILGYLEGSSKNFTHRFFNTHRFTHRLTHRFTHRFFNFWFMVRITDLYSQNFCEKMYFFR